MRKKILLADDEPDILKVYRARLSLLGYEVVTARDGEETLELLRQEKPDLVLLDYRMPLLNGHQVCKIVKEDEHLKHTPIILITASPTSTAPELLESVQADDFLIKPFDASELLEKINRYLG